MQTQYVDANHTICLYRIAWAGTFPSDLENILPAITTAAISKEFNVNTVSLWAAAQLAVAGWEKLDPALPKALIYTGNQLPWVNLPKFLSLGIGKASSAYIIESLANTYGKRGFRQVKTPFSCTFSILHTDIT